MILSQSNKIRINVNGNNFDIMYTDFYDDYVYLENRMLAKLTETELAYWRSFEETCNICDIIQQFDELSFYNINERYNIEMLKYGLVRQNEFINLFSSFGKSPLFFPAVWSPASLFPLLTFWYSMFTESWTYHGDQHLIKNQTKVKLRVREECKKLNISVEERLNIVNDMFTAFDVIRRLRNFVQHMPGTIKDNTLHWKMMLLNLGLLNVNHLNYPMNSFSKYLPTDDIDQLTIWLKGKGDFTSQKLELIIKDHDVWKDLFRIISLRVKQFNNMHPISGL